MGLVLAGEFRLSGCHATSLTSARIELAGGAQISPMAHKKIEPTGRPFFTRETHASWEGQDPSIYQPSPRSLSAFNLASVIGFWRRPFRVPTPRAAFSLAIRMRSERRARSSRKALTSAFAKEAISDGSGMYFRKFA